MSKTVGFKQIDGQNIYYEYYQKAVESPTLVMLHEGLGSVAQWKDIPQRLFQSTQYHILVYDRSGYGQSGTVSNDYADDYLRYESKVILAGLLDALKIDSCSLFGHSDGGSVALLFGAFHPQRCQKIFSEAAHVIIEDISREGIARVRKIYERKLKYPLTKYHGKKTDWVFYHWADTWLHPKKHSWNMLKELESISCPVVAIQGDKDEYGSPKQLTLIQEKCPNAQTILLENCGHSPHLEFFTDILNVIRK